MTNTLSEETPNTHQKSQKICENLLVWKKNKLAFISWLYILPFWKYLFFLRIFSHIFHMCFGSNTPSTAIQVLLRLLRDNNLPLLREAKGSVSPVDSRPQNTWAPCVLTMAEILWPVETDIVSISCFSPRVVHAKWCRISSVASVDKIPMADLEAWYMSDLWV